MARVLSEITVNTPPRWFVWLVKLLTPQTGGLCNRDYILKDLWKKYPSMREALPHLPSQLGRAIYLRTINRLYLQMAVAQACILFLFFAAGNVVTAAMLLILGLTFLCLMVREVYLNQKERLEGEIITTAVAPALIVLFYAGLHLSHFLMGWQPPRLMSGEALAPRVMWLSLVIGFVRYHTAPAVGPDHPFEGLLRLHRRIWYFNNLWLAGAVAYLFATQLAAPSNSFILPFFTNPAIMFFSTAIRMQLNPIGARYRHSMILLGLLTNPDEEEIRMKRDYLLVGADWFHGFTLQSLCEILGFAFALAPLLIAIYEWHIGHPNAATIDWVQMAANAAAWIMLMVTWPYVKMMNRRTAIPFNAAIQTFRRQRFAA